MVGYSLIFSREKKSDEILSQHIVLGDTPTIPVSPFSWNLYPIVYAGNYTSQPLNHPVAKLEIKQYSTEINQNRYMKDTRNLIVDFERGILGCHELVINPVVKHIENKNLQAILIEE